MPKRYDCHPRYFYVGIPPSRSLGAEAEVEDPEVGIRIKKVICWTEVTILSFIFEFSLMNTNSFIQY